MDYWVRYVTIGHTLVCSRSVQNNALLSILMLMRVNTYRLSDISRKLCIPKYENCDNVDSKKNWLFFGYQPIKQNATQKKE